MIKKYAALITFLALICALLPLVGEPPHISAAAPTFGRVHETFQPEKGKIFVLAIGNDARSGNPDSALADAIHLIGINTKTMKAGVLNFPRDSYVNIPGYGSAKINEGLFAGGPQRVADTVENLTGIRIDYWLMTGFVGFQQIIKELDGVKMNIPTAHNDTGASGSVLSAGVQKLKGHEALAYARARKVFSGGDIARSTHQGDILLALQRKLHVEAAKNPASLLRWVTVTKQHTRFDLSAEEMFRLGIIATQIKPKDVGHVTVPVSLGHVGAASVVFISPGARSIYERFKANGSL